MKKILGILSALLAFILISSSACIKAPPKPGLTNTYQNTTYGFSLRYPQGWVKEETGKRAPLLIIHDPNRIYQLQVFLEYLPKVMTSESYAAKVIAELRKGVSEFKLISEKEVKIGDKTGYEQVFTLLGPQKILLKAKLISLVRGSQGFSILALAPADKFALQEDLIDSIIFSFRVEELQPLNLPRQDSLVLFDIGPITLDPALVREVTSAAYVSEIFSGLVTLDKKLHVVPDIAERWEISRDGKTYTFYLRKGVRFHNGKEVKAGDFKYSFERACDPKTGSKTAENYLGDIVGVKEKLSGKAKEISGVKVLDDYTLQITIDAPKPYFLYKLTHAPAFVVDRENVESGKDWWRRPNGTGPFKLKEWRGEEILVLERNELYYGEMPKVKYVIFRLWGGVPMTMYETGEIDIASVSSANIERVLDPTNPLHKELIKIPQFSLWYVGFNTTKPPFDDPKVRQAFCYAVDKEKIIKLVLKGIVERADGILPPGMPGYNKQLKGLNFDPEKAKELIAQSKYKSVSNLPMITFTTSGRGEVSPLNAALVDQWRRNLGVEVQIRQLEPEKYPYVIKEEKDEIFDLGWVADYPDPQNFLDPLFHTGSADNVGEYSNPKVDALLDAAGREQDPEVRMKMYQEAEQLIINDAACLPLFFDVNYVLVKPYVKGFVATPLPIPWLKYISLEPH